MVNQKKLEENRGKLATVIGRYFAMDRDQRWERIKKTYDLLVNGNGKLSHDIQKDIKESYHSGVTDEFIEPLVAVDENSKPLAKISNDDVLIFFNFQNGSRKATHSSTFSKIISRISNGAIKPSLCNPHQLR